MNPDCRLKVVNEGCCRVTGSHYRVAAHHVVPKSQGGEDVPENIVPLNNDFHVFSLHQGKDSLEARKKVRAVLKPEEIEYILRTKGEEWLRQKYPT
jgi:hypothetical protein